MRNPVSFCVQQAASQLASFLNLPKIGPKEVAVAMQVNLTKSLQCSAVRYNVLLCTLVSLMNMKLSDNGGVDSILHGITPVAELLWIVLYSCTFAVIVQMGFSRWNDVAPKSGKGRQEQQPTFGGQKMEFFFSQRMALWPLLDAAKLFPVFAPRSPFAWPRR